MIRQKRQTGAGLVEVMISLALGLVLTGTLLSLVLSNRESYRLSENLMRLHDTARFVMDEVGGAVRNAGYGGCVASSRRLKGIRVWLNGATTDWRYREILRAVEGSEAKASTWSPLPDKSLSAPLAGNDTLSLRTQLSASGAITLASPMATLDAPIRAQSVDEIEDGQTLLISDCRSADLFQVTQVDRTGKRLLHSAGAGSPGNYSASLSVMYDTRAEAQVFEVRSYYIGQGLDGRPGLWRVINSNAPEQIASGVQALQIEYGTDGDGNGEVERFVPADQVGDWASVRAVRLSWLFATEDELAKQAPVLSYHGGVYRAQDRRVYRALTQTVQVRNSG